MAQYAVAAHHLHRLVAGSRQVRGDVNEIGVDVDGRHPLSQPAGSANNAAL